MTIFEVLFNHSNTANGMSDVLICNKGCTATKMEKNEH
jgi:hypothetical protein